ncbi:translation initiation factor IF-2 [Elasticomyces elasticus]|nr:translation initiation factor IF-2 [Elasticomyces elasticus]
MLCACRLGGEAVSASTFVQRRYHQQRRRLQSSRTLPQSTAAASIAQNDHTTQPSSLPTFTSQRGDTGGWGATFGAVTSLAPHEEAERAALKARLAQAEKARHALEKAAENQRRQALEEAQAARRSRDAPSVVRNVPTTGPPQPSHTAVNTRLKFKMKSSNSVQSQEAQELPVAQKAQKESTQQSQVEENPQLSIRNFVPSVGGKRNKRKPQSDAAVARKEAPIRLANSMLPRDQVALPRGQAVRGAQQDDAQQATRKQDLRQNLGNATISVRNPDTPNISQKSHPRVSASSSISPQVDGPISTPEWLSTPSQTVRSNLLPATWGSESLPPRSNSIYRAQHDIPKQDEEMQHPLTETKQSARQERSTSVGGDARWSMGRINETAKVVQRAQIGDKHRHREVPEENDSNSWASPFGETSKEREVRPGRPEHSMQRTNGETQDAALECSPPNVQTNRLAQSDLGARQDTANVTTSPAAIDRSISGNMAPPKPLEEASSERSQQRPFVFRNPNLQDPGRFEYRAVQEQHGSGVQERSTTTPVDPRNLLDRGAAQDPNQLPAFAPNLQHGSPSWGSSSAPASVGPQQKHVPPHNTASSSTSGERFQQDSGWGVGPPHAALQRPAQQAAPEQRTTAQLSDLERGMLSLLSARDDISPAEWAILKQLLKKQADLSTKAPQTITQPKLELSDAEQRERAALRADHSRKPLPTDREVQELDRSPYNVTMSESSPIQAEHTTYDPSITANWAHLRSKSEPAPHSEQTLPTVPRHRQSSFLEPEEVDARFAEHARRRQVSSAKVDVRYTTPHYANPNPFIDDPFPVGDNNTLRRCGRCNEPGHTASECKGIPKMLCYNCGESGHSARECPTRQPRFFERGRDRSMSPGNQQPFDSQRQLPDNTGPVRYRPLSAAVHDDGHSQQTRPERGQIDPFNNEREVGRWAFARNTTEDPRYNSQSLTVSNPGDSDLSQDTSFQTVRRPPSRFARDEDEDEPDRFAARDRERKRGARRSRLENNEDDDADEGDVYDHDAAKEERMRRKRMREEKAAKKAAKQAAKEEARADALTPINLPQFISVSNLANALGVKYEGLVDKMQDLGFMDVSHDLVLNADNAGLIAMEYKFDPVTEGQGETQDEDRDLHPRPEVEDKEFLPTRPPVVTIMGHVDHGKTTILDYLRKSSVAATEHGGITQHIGAFSVLMSSGRTITFLDTPGHAAFLAMRQRGANVTDIVVLVVAADDSVKPQTIEAIKHAKAAAVPIIVAINKVDKEEADVQRVKQDLARHGIEIEDFGGETQVVEVSGKTGQGMEDLEETIVTLSEILDYRAETDGPVEGWVLEGTTKKAGRIATVLVRRGTLVPGNIIVAGKTWTRVRTLKNEAGIIVHSAGPGLPVEVDGWREQPVAGEQVLQAPNEQKATSVVEYRIVNEERLQMAKDIDAINESRRLEQEKRDREEAATKILADDTKDSQDKNLRQHEDEKPKGPQKVEFIIKADVSGSVEAVSAYITSVGNAEISPKILRSGVGPVSEFDIEHAAAASGHIISFNLPADPVATANAEKRGVKVLEQNIIYRVLDDVKAVLSEKLPPLVTQRVVAEAEVAMDFNIGVGGRKKIKIAGVKVRNGTVNKGSRVRVLRNGEKIYDGTITSLKNVKRDVTEMRKGSECGMGFDAWEGFEPGDQIQTYEEKVEKRTL